mmetsp:Transcript_104096/g.303923  ORF Transcript_104096/g.303923 Transcript_104096/m.303923 type:complete len:598 (-) Transcript_104096:133-1926(-)
MSAAGLSETPCGAVPEPNAPPSPLLLKLIAYVEAFAPYTAEFFGTFFIVFTVGCNTISGDRTWMPTSISFCVMVAMYATAGVSGGHLNPALSFAFGLSWKLRWHRVLGYMLAQVSAGLLAGWLSRVLLETPILVGPKEGYDWFDSMIVEVVYSSMYCFVGLNCMASLRNNPKTDRNQFFALAVGFVSIAGGHTTGTISGAFFNPAMTLGFGLTSGSLSQHFWTLLYAGYQLAGSIVATVLFFMVRPEELAALGISAEGLSCRKACSALSLCGGARESGDVEARTTEESAQHRAERAYAPFPARVLSEFIGTYLIVFTFGLSKSMDSVQAHALMANSTVPGVNGTVLMMHGSELLDRQQAGLQSVRVGPYSMVEVLQSSTVAWATGAAVLCMVYSLANVSGGHFNPAVTLAVMCTGSCAGPGRRKCRLIEGLFFMLAQVGAGVTAALTYVCVHRSATRKNAHRVADLGPHSGYGWTSVAIGECVFTLAVALSVLCMTTVRDPRYPKAPSTRSFQFAWAIGMCVTAGSFALEGITGGYLNPGVDVGIVAANFIYSGLVLDTRISVLVHYVSYQMLGGVLAAIVFRMVHPLEYKEDPLLQ